MTTVYRLLEQGKLRQALTRLREQLAGLSLPMAQQELDNIASDYGLMLDYMCKGYRDTQREELYANLLRRAFRLAANTDLEQRKKQLHVFAEASQKAHHLNLSHDFIRSVLEGFVSDLAFLSLEPEELRSLKEEALHQRHQQFVDQLFNALWTSPQWSLDDRRFFQQLVLSPAISVRDAQLMVSGVMLGCMNVFDVNKLLMLMDVYVHAEDEHVRQRALVGWVFAMPTGEATLFQEVRDRLRELAGSPSIARELLEFQEQLYLCINAEKDQIEIQRDIIPAIMENSHLNITRYGITEKDDDPMEDILHPDAAEKAMEEVERSVQRMMDMQKAGADIYFGGFSHMKSYPFFTSLANWFCPFYIEHPMLNQQKTKLGNNRFMTLLFERGPFCDSDKYSFVLALSSIIDKIPSNMREMMGNEAALGQVGDEKEMRSPAYLRRMYLQDLYRFFKVYPRRMEVYNPFLVCLFMSSALLQTEALLARRMELVRFLMKQGRWPQVTKLFDSWPPDDATNSDERLLLGAYIAMHQEKYTDACSLLQQLASRQPANDFVTRQLARCSMLSGQYEQAEKLYVQLHQLQPDRKSYAVNLSVVYIKQAKYEQAEELLYRLHYEYQDDLNIERILAWCLLCSKKLEQAQRLYDQIIVSDEVSGDDFINAAYSRWLADDYQNAITLFTRYKSWTANQDNQQPQADEVSVTLEQKILNDWSVIVQYGKTTNDLQLMLDLIASSS